jgi:hypothetical protein
MSIENEKRITRRTFLEMAGKFVGGLAFASGKLCAVARANERDKEIDDLELYDFVMPRVKFTPYKRQGQQRLSDDTWNNRPGGDANLLTRLSTVIRCRTKPITGANNWQPQWAQEGQLNGVVTFNSLDQVKKYPFLFMTGENYFQFNNDQKYNLKEYITRGGFLLMDDCVVGDGGDFFYQSAFRTLVDTFGKGAVKRIPSEHEVFHNVYDLGETGLPTVDYVYRKRPGGLPYMHGQNHGARGVFMGDRLAVFLSSTDIHCGWCDSLGIEWGRANYEKAIEMGINIIMYAMSH